MISSVLNINTAKAAASAAFTLLTLYGVASGVNIVARYSFDKFNNRGKTNLVPHLKLEKNQELSAKVLGVVAGLASSSAVAYYSGLVSRIAT